MIPAETLITWRQSLASARGRRRVSQHEAADRLLVAHRTYERWEAAGCPYDHIALALRAVRDDLPPYSP